jgi:hypothetical protein
MTLNGLYLVGGQQQSLRPLSAGNQEWYRYRKGVILHVDLASERVSNVLEYVSPPEVCPAENPAILFKSATLVGNRLYACTQTEVMVYGLPDFRLLHYVTLPQFNDVHHVRPTCDGTLLVANTGLDMIIEMTPEGTVVREWGVLDEDPWQRFSRSTDYRLISTKPHRSHPNHIFCVGADVWSTRFEQRDAICLTDRSKRIDIGLERLHDGVVKGDRVYFTTVDGKIVIANHVTLRVEEVIDLTKVSGSGDFLGWCRGLYIDDSDTFWVGFSRLRPTKFRENVSWVMNGFKRFVPARVCGYDLASRTCLTTIDLESNGMNAVFSVHPAPSARELVLSSVPIAASPMELAAGA